MDPIVITQPAETAGTPEHIAAMVAKADGQIVPETPPVTEGAPAGDRPAWLPEKFATPEDMAKAYSELETKQGGKPADPAAPELNPDGTPKVPEGSTSDEATKELATKGLDLAEFSTEFSTKGELGPESYAKLEAAGYPKTIVDQYIAGQKALAVSYENEVKAAAGGEEKFAAAADWAKTNLTDPEKAAYNAAIDSGDIEQSKLAVAGLAAKYNAANPSEGNLLGGRTTTTSGDSYTSTAEMKVDMADERYAKDPAFRDKVMQKLSRSNIM